MLRRASLGVVLATIAATGLGTGVARAEHNYCHDNGVWVLTAGVSAGTNPGVCVGDAGIFVDATSHPGAIGILTCDFSSSPPWCAQGYGYYGVDGPPKFFRPTCVEYYTYGGGGQPERHTVGADCDV